MQKEYIGVVEDRKNDPLKLGRCRVRIFGIHTPDKIEQPTESLPWCPIRMSAINGSQSGIGVSPTGLLENTWVTLECLDGDDLQQFIITGTTLGYQSRNSDEIDFGGVITDPNQPTSNPAPQPAQQDPIPAPSPQPADSKLASGTFLGSTSEFFETGGRGPGTINNYLTSNDIGGLSAGSYQLASYSPPVMPNGKSRQGYNGSPLQSYLKQSKYGPKFSELIPGIDPQFDVIWKQIASQDPQGFKDDQHAFVKKLYYDVMINKLKIAGLDLSGYNLAVQNLIWSSAVQLGPGKISIFTIPLQGKSNLSDTDIVTLVSDYKIGNVGSLFSSSDSSIQQSVRSRWIKEKQILLALCNGQVIQLDNVIRNGDPYDPNNPTNNRKLIGGNFGFGDPNGIYPKQDYENLPDTNKLAYGREDGTPSAAKTANRKSGINLTNGASFDQPQNPYAAKYPYNIVFESEAGHVVEFDSTPGAERINVYHKSGAFWEIDSFGNSVRRTVGSDFQIIDKNAYIAVDGKMNVSIGGSVNLMVGGNADVQVDGNTTLNCGNDIKANAGGRLSLAAAEAIDIKSQNIFIDAESAINMRSGNTYIQTDNNFNVLSGATTAIDGSAIHLNSGLADGADLSETALPSGRTAFSESDITEQFQTKADNTAIQVESPEDESSVAAFHAQLIKDGLATADQLNSTPVELARDVSPNPKVNQKSVVDCVYINTLNNIPDDFRLSHNFTLGDLSSKAAVSHYPVQAQLGKTKAQLVCSLYQLANNVLEPIKQNYTNAFVTSAFRTADSSIGTSQHPLGQACDLQFAGARSSDYYDIAVKIKSLLINGFDQLILEYKTYGTGQPWIHVSFNEGHNRGQILTMLNNKTYSQGLVKLL